MKVIYITFRIVADTNFHFTIGTSSRRKINHHANQFCFAFIFRSSTSTWWDKLSFNSINLLRICLSTSIWLDDGIESNILTARLVALIIRKCFSGWWHIWSSIVFLIELRGEFQFCCGGYNITLVADQDGMDYWHFKLCWSCLSTSHKIYKKLGVWG